MSKSIESQVFIGDNQATVYPRDKDDDSFVIEIGANPLHNGCFEIAVCHDDLTEPLEISLSMQDINNLISDIFLK